MQLSLSELSRRVPFVVWRNLDGHDEFSFEAQGSALTRSRRAHPHTATGVNTSLKWRRPSVPVMKTVNRRDRRDRGGENAKNSRRALRALRSSVAFFHRLFRPAERGAEAPRHICENGVSQSHVGGFRRRT